MGYNSGVFLTGCWVPLELSTILSLLIQHSWRFCQEYNCGAPDRVENPQDRVWTRLWLQQLKGDPFKMRRLRDLLAKQQVPLPPSRVADDTVVQKIAELLTSGRLHIHAKAMGRYAPGGVTASEKESAAFPISEHRSREPEAAPEFIDPPSFPAKANLVAQAAALSAAAAAGSPFCPV